MRTNLAKSSLTGVAQFLVNTALVFFTIPTFVRILGTDAYGVFSLVAIVGSVNTFANLGLNSSLVFFLAKQGKTQESDHDIIVTFIVLLSILLPLTAIGLLYQDQILTNIFSIPNQLMNDGKWLFVSALICNVFVLVGQTFTAVLDSQQKIYLTNSFQMIYNFAYWSLILLAISLDYALKGVAIATLVATVIWFSIVVVSALQSWGGLSLKGLKRNAKRIARKQLSYGLQIYAAGVVSLFYEPITKIFISRFVGVPAVGVFDIGLRVRNQVVGLVTKLLSPLYPAISQLTDEDKIRSLIHDVEQKTFFIVMPLAGIAILAAKPAVGLIFHANVDAISNTVAYLVVAYLVCSTTILPMYLFLMAKGYASKNVFLQSMNVIVNAAVLFVALPWLNYYAAVASNVVAIASTFAVILFFQKKYLNSLIFDNVEQVLKVFLSFIVAVGLGYACRFLVPTDIWKLVLSACVVVIVTTLFYRQFAVVKAADILRYFGERNALSRISSRLLLRASE